MFIFYLRLPHITLELEAVIGFVDLPYEFNEGDGEGDLVIGVINGALKTELFMELSFSEGTALSKFLSCRLSF